MSEFVLNLRNEAGDILDTLTGTKAEIIEKLKELGKTSTQHRVWAEFLSDQWGYN